MLRASSEASGETIDLLAVGDSTRDPLIAGGVELRELADAAVLRDIDERDAALPRVVAAVGRAGAVRAAATAGNFEMMNRLLDGIGVGPPEAKQAIAPVIGVSWPRQPN